MIEYFNIFYLKPQGNLQKSHVHLVFSLDFNFRL